ncbi:unnamed protein product [Mytilus coruscus]|uniref:Uncharacterized protein n=1 Tax=Mytilus coruscus TaxID=42192 RepID=A0A6J8ESI6_MYTCO|nr:unnamed protein product [Mytilus coruscus]
MLVRRSFPTIDAATHRTLSVEYMLRGLTGQSIAIELLTKRITSMTEAIHQVTLYETYRRGNRDRNIRQLSTQDTIDSNECEDDVEIRNVRGKRYVTEERLTQFERGMKDSITKSITQSVGEIIQKEMSKYYKPDVNQQVEIAGQVTAPKRLEKLITGNTVEIKDTSISTVKYTYDDDEFDIFDQDLSLDLLFENIEEVQKSAPRKVSGSAKPSHEIEENIIIDRFAAATITVPLVISKVETEAVINAGIVIAAGEGENGEGKLDILAWHENKEEINIPESLIQSSEIVQISNVVNDGIQTNKANIQMMPEILEDWYIHDIHVRSSKNLANEGESSQLLLIDQDEIVAFKTEVEQKLKRVLENAEHRTKDFLKDWRKKKKRPEEDTRKIEIMKDLKTNEETRRGHRKKGHHKKLEEKKEKTRRKDRRKVPKEKNHNSISTIFTLFICIVVAFD